MNWTVNFFEIFAVAVGCAGLLLSFVTYRSLVARTSGNEKMLEIAAAIREGSFAYLKAQALYLIPFVGIVFLLLAFSKLGFPFQNTLFLFKN